VELGLVLREVRGHDAVSEPRRAGNGLPPAKQRLEQRRLAASVRADEGDVLAALERERDPLEQLLLACRQRQALDLQHRSPAARRREEVEPEPTRSPLEQRELVGGGGAFLLQSPDVRELRLGLLRLRLLVPEPIDES